MNESEQTPKVFRFEKEDDVVEGKLTSIQASKFSKLYSIQTLLREALVFGSKTIARIRSESRDAIGIW